MLIDTAESQIQETVEQELAGITVRMATITCPCGAERSLVMMYKCLYCKTWLCHSCAEDHFGQTVRDYRASQEQGQ